MLMSDLDEMQLPDKYPAHIYQDWGLLAVLIGSTAMIVVIEVLQLPMPFLTLPSIF